jgi:hypothetical protein
MNHPASKGILPTKSLQSSSRYPCRNSVISSLGATVLVLFLRGCADPIIVEKLLALCSLLEKSRSYKASVVEVTNAAANKETLFNEQVPTPQPVFHRQPLNQFSLKLTHGAG